MANNWPRLARNSNEIRVQEGSGRLPTGILTSRILRQGARQEERSELWGTLQSPPGTTVKLEDIDPSFKNHHEGHKEAAKEIEHYRQRLRELQELLYADGRRSLLICLQALDAGGKDGTIEHILGSMNPQGCKVVGFKQPSAFELAHDFLWRIHRAAPARGEVTIFNRSHYEDVLIARVHKLVPEEIWSRRYDRINAFESGLVEDDTDILNSICTSPNASN